MMRISALRAPLLFMTLPLAACSGQMESSNSEPSGTPSGTTPTPGTNPGTPGTPTTGGQPTQPGQPGAQPANPGTNVPGPSAEALLPFEPLPPAAYAAKVKDLLTGLPLTDDERRLVTADPKPAPARVALKGLIDKWMTTEQFKNKMFHFFKQSFQQTQLDRSDLEEQLRISELPGADQTKLLRAVEEMFAKTVLDIVSNNRPFTEALTTTRFMMNTPLMVALAYMDAAPKNDTNGAVTAGYWILNKYPKENPFKFQMVTNVDPLTGVATPIPFEETINPASPNFMKFVFRQPDPLKYMPCKDPIVSMGTSAISYTFRAMYGGRQACQGAQGEAGVFTDADWNNWRMVTVRPPKDANEERTLFYDLPKVRTANELVVATPRVGFMTTPAFFANWPTNPSNQYRVTLNQALIVGLGKSFDDAVTAVQVAETGDPAQHVQPNTPCFGCHQTLDPMRDFYKQSYSMTFSQQLDLKNPKNPMPEWGTFQVDDVAPVRGKGIADLAKAMTTHPRFPTAWTQKLCTLANSEPCVEDDIEFKRVSDEFKKAFNFKTLVRELLSSKIVTFAEPSKTSEVKGVVMSIARRETFCSRFSERLGIKDVCNQNSESGLPRIAASAKNLSLGVPGSAYSRADEMPMMPHDPNMFFIAATEKLCWALAGQLIDGPAVAAGATPTTKWLSRTQKDQAVLDFVVGLMGVPPSDPKHGALIDILNRHYADAVAAKEIPADALRSTFVVACSSPLAVSTGL